MSLWTPYADQALDLSKSAVKTKRVSSCIPSPVDHRIPQAVLPILPTNYADPQFPVCTIGYQPYSIPITQYSPPAIKNHYQTFTTPPMPLEHTFNSFLAPSPPTSPDSLPSSKHCSDADSLSDDPDFQMFEKDALRVMAEKNGGTLLGNNPRMRRSIRISSNMEDDAYRKQRERNNFAAKQSRDRRKLREIHLALKVTYLRNEMARLKRSIRSQPCKRCHQNCDC